jgi:hypothetical protein
MALEQETQPLELSHHEWARAFGVKRAGGTDYRKALQHDPCSYCGNPYRHGLSSREIDHIHPRAKGGPNGWQNYTSACGFCNVLKFDHSMLAWLLELRDVMEFGPPHAGAHWVALGSRPGDDAGLIVRRRVSCEPREAAA